MIKFFTKCFFLNPYINYALLSNNCFYSLTIFTFVCLIVVTMINVVNVNVQHLCCDCFFDLVDFVFNFFFVDCVFLDICFFDFCFFYDIYFFDFYVFCVIYFFDFYVFCVICFFDCCDFYDVFCDVFCLIFFYCCVLFCLSK